MPDELSNEDRRLLQWAHAVRPSFPVMKAVKELAEGFILAALVGYAAVCILYLAFGTASVMVAHGRVMGFSSLALVMTVLAGLLAYDRKRRECVDWIKAHHEHRAYIAWLTDLHAFSADDYKIVVACGTGGWSAVLMTPRGCPLATGIAAGPAAAIRALYEEAQTRSVGP